MEGLNQKFLDLLELAKECAAEAGNSLHDLSAEENLRHEYDSHWNREIKAQADYIIEAKILKKLGPTGIPILSEESGLVGSKSSEELEFIVDPIDGTANFLRGLGQSTVSIALFRANQPVFGVLYIFPDKQTAWGGPKLGSFVDNRPIQVSKEREISRSILCTGIPSRLDLSQFKSKERFFELISQFAKVRMLGAASISLLQVARGVADYYSEQEVMIWDVAAGLAILAGAGGAYTLSPGSHPNSCSVIAQNGCLSP